MCDIKLQQYKMHNVEGKGLGSLMQPSLHLKQ